MTLRCHSQLNAAGPIVSTARCLGSCSFPCLRRSPWNQDMPVLMRVCITCQMQTIKRSSGNRSQSLHMTCTEGHCRGNYLDLLLWTLRFPRRKGPNSFVFLGRFVVETRGIHILEIALMPTPCWNHACRRVVIITRGGGERDGCRDLLARPMEEDVVAMLRSDCACHGKNHRGRLSGCHAFVLLPWGTVQPVALHSWKMLSSNE